MRTPYYIFQKQKFIELLSQYKKFAEVYYPIKANDNPHIVRTVIDNGCAFEVDSIQHIVRLVRRFAVDPRKIIFSFPIKKNQEIILANKLGVAKYVVDSFDEYKKIKENVKNPEYIIRLNANTIVSGLVASQDKWGVAPSEILDIVSQIEADGGKLYGISFYLSAEINNIVNFRKVFGYLKTIDLTRFSVVDIGGGISIDKINLLASDIDEIRMLTGGHKIIVEPGKDLLDPCIQMKVSITAIKQSVDGRKILFIDSGIYNGLLDVVVKKKRFKITDLKEDKKIEYYICGCSSDVSDYIGRYYLSESLAVGDFLVIDSCGAYSAVMTTNFYAQKKPGLKLFKENH